MSDDQRQHLRIQRRISARKRVAQRNDEFSEQQREHQRIIDSQLRFHRSNELRELQREQNCDLEHEQRERPGKQRCKQRIEVQRVSQNERNQLLKSRVRTTNNFDGENREQNCDTAQEQNAQPIKQRWKQRIEEQRSLQNECKDLHGSRARKRSNFDGNFDGANHRLLLLAEAGAELLLESEKKKHGSARNNQNQEGSRPTSTVPQLQELFTDQKSKDQQPNATDLEVKSDVGNNNLRRQGRTRLSQLRCQARLRNTQLVEKADVDHVQAQMDPWSAKVPLDSYNAPSFETERAGHNRNGVATKHTTQKQQEIDHAAEQMNWQSDKEMELTIDCHHTPNVVTEHADRHNFIAELVAKDCTPNVETQHGEQAQQNMVHRDDPQIVEEVHTEQVYNEMERKRAAVDRATISSAKRARDREYQRLRRSRMTDEERERERFLNRQYKERRFLEDHGLLGNSINSSMQHQNLGRTSQSNTPLQAEVMQPRISFINGAQPVENNGRMNKISPGNVQDGINQFGSQVNRFDNIGVLKGYNEVAPHYTKVVHSQSQRRQQRILIISKLREKKREIQGLAVQKHQTKISDAPSQMPLLQICQQCAAAQLQVPQVTEEQLRKQQWNIARERRHQRTNKRRSQQWERLSSAAQQHGHLMTDEQKDQVCDLDTEHQKEQSSDAAEQLIHLPANEQKEHVCDAKQVRKQFSYFAWEKGHLLTEEQREQIRDAEQQWKEFNAGRQHSRIMLDKHWEPIRDYEQQPVIPKPNIARQRRIEMRREQRKRGDAAKQQRTMIDEQRDNELELGNDSHQSIDNNQCPEDQHRVELLDAAASQGDIQVLNNTLRVQGKTRLNQLRRQARLRKTHSLVGVHVDRVQGQMDHQSYGDSCKSQTAETMQEENIHEEKQRQSDAGQMLQERLHATGEEREQETESPGLASQRHQLEIADEQRQQQRMQIMHRCIDVQQQVVLITEEHRKQLRELQHIIARQQRVFRTNKRRKLQWERRCSAARKQRLLITDEQRVQLRDAQRQWLLRKPDMPREHRLLTARLQRAQRIKELRASQSGHKRSSRWQERKLSNADGGNHHLSVQLAVGHNFKHSIKPDKKRSTKPDQIPEDQPRVDQQSIAALVEVNNEVERKILRVKGLIRLNRLRHQARTRNTHSL